jgi:hypothetical protein
LAWAYFWRNIDFWERPIFGKEELILEHAQQVERKKHVENEGKATCRRKINMAHMKTRLTMIGLGFWTIF